MTADEVVPSPVVFTDVVVTTVEPLEKTNHLKTIDPTAMDMLTVDAFVPTIFVYRLADSSDAVYKEAADRIKDGLRKVLVPFFPWAGRWFGVPDGRERRLLCNDEGIPFIEAYADRSLDSVLQISSDYRRVPELQGYSSLGMDPKQFRQPMVAEGRPCIFVQVTRFKCGGLVVASTFSHMHADGKSFCDFMKAWSDISRTGKTDLTMDPNREAIDATSRNGMQPDALVYSPPSLVWDNKCYEVSSASIEALKKEIKDENQKAYITTADCILAHLWKSLANLPLSITKGREIGMLSAVEGRKRFYDPPLPDLLCNVFLPMRAPNVPPADLVKMPVSHLASKIREKMLSSPRESWLSDERIAESLAVHGNDKVLPWTHTSWQSFPMYEVDFGFGTPIFTVGLNAHHTWEVCGMSFVGPPTPSVPSSVAYLYLQCLPEVLEAIEQQPDFQSLFVPKQ